jgi:hypothetical protein
VPPVVIVLPVPLGIVPGCGGAVFPEDPGAPAGPGIVTGLDPDSIDPGWQVVDDAPPPIPDDGVDVVPIDAQWQNTRYVTLCNASEKKLKVKITYETLNEDDDVVDGDAEVEIDPAEVCDLTQGAWPVNAVRIKIVVVYPDGTELKRFRDEWLTLVPETDDQGVPGYASPSVQRASISLR